MRLYCIYPMKVSLIKVLVNVEVSREYLLGKAVSCNLRLTGLYYSHILTKRHQLFVFRKVKCAFNKIQSFFNAA